MPNLNKTLLIGNLTRDPEMRYSSKGTAVAGFGLAVNRKYKSAAGTIEEETTFLDVSAFGHQAETVSKFLKKGAAVFVEGRLRLDQWDDKNTGQKRSKIVVIADRVQFLSPRKATSAADDRIAIPVGSPAGADCPGDDGVPF